MDIEVTKTCPLGHSCRKVVGEAVEECMWYIKMEGENPQNGDRVDLYDCTINWQTILIVEGNKEQRGTAASVQSLRNETIKRQDAALGVIASAQKHIEHN